MHRVLVPGGRGFVGRHAVQALRDAGCEVVVGSRREAQGDASIATLALERLTRPEGWAPLLDGFDAVVNCVGILRQRFGETYDAVHHRAPAALAAACARRGCRFVHVSALGISLGARSRFLTSKRRGELAIEQAGGDWIIVRPSLLDGEGGFGAAWLRGVSRLPVFVIPADAQGCIAALWVDELGAALARLATASGTELRLEESRCFELGGVHAVSFEDYIRGLRRRHTNARALGIRIPGWVARLGAHLCDVVHFSPFSFGHRELLLRDNVPMPNRLGELLGRDPRPVLPPDSAGT